MKYLFDYFVTLEHRKMSEGTNSYHSPEMSQAWKSHEGMMHKSKNRVSHWICPNDHLAVCCVETAINQGQRVLGSQSYNYCWHTTKRLRHLHERILSWLSMSPFSICCIVWWSYSCQRSRILGDWWQVLVKSIVWFITGQRCDVSLTSANPFKIPNFDQIPELLQVLFTHSVESNGKSLR